MSRVEKTVFLSYRRTNFPWALAVYQDLTHQGFDVFMDYLKIGPGDFETIILENISARAHFLLLLTPSALERCSEEGDWLRREIEWAIAKKRNIVPLLMEGFSFGTPAIANQLTGGLAPLNRYNGLGVPAEYFAEAMQRLRTQRLNVALDAVPHPASAAAQEAAQEQKVAANEAPKVQEEELTAQQYFERGFESTDHDEEIRFFSEAIRLDPSLGLAFSNRGTARQAKGDVDGALEDYGEAIRLNPQFADAFYNRGTARQAKGDVDGALEDYDEAIRLNPQGANAFSNRGTARQAKGDVDGALEDYDEAIRLNPQDANAFYNRGIARKAKGDVDGALEDYGEAIRLNPQYANAFYNRGTARKAKGDVDGAIEDYQSYLDLGGGARDGDTESVEGFIVELKSR